MMYAEKSGVENRGFEDIALSETSSSHKKGEVRGSTVSFHDITYQVEVKESLRGPKFTKTILNTVSGVFKPGLNAILGPTGGGKTSLLDILAARKDPEGLSGAVLIDGKEQPKNFRLISGYVVQDDVIMGTLSVRENLMFSASLRLPSTVSNDERKERVEEVIEELGLTACANTKIGTQFIRGVSGGERKRTNIGMELVTQPGVLFLDEPTTGLDATTASAVIQHLARLSLRGRTIIFSIHQPRFTIFRYFDRLHLLSLGDTVYHGSSKTALQYFSEIGFECEEHNNPADFFLDTIIGNEKAIRKRESQTGLATVENGTYAAVSQEKLSDVFKKSEEFRALDKECKQILPTPREGKQQKADRQKIPYATSFLTQLGVVSTRAAKNVIRNPFVVFAQNFILLIFAVLGGLIYFQMDESRPSGTQNRMGAFFFLSMQQIFANMSGMEIFIMERAIFLHESASDFYWVAPYFFAKVFSDLLPLRFLPVMLFGTVACRYSQYGPGKGQGVVPGKGHESASGFYRVAPYFLAKVFTDLLPLRFLPVLLFGTVAYWMMGLKPEVGPYFIFLLTLVLTSFVATGVAFAMSSTFKQLSVATLSCALVFITSMIFGGVLVNITSLPEWIQWIQYLSLFRYTINALSVNEFVGLNFCRENGTDCISGEMVLDEQGITYTTWGLWQNHVALTAFILFFFTLAYIQLRRIPKYK